VQNIASFAGLNRTSAYDILNSLQNKGFVSCAIKSGKKHYMATQPSRLLSMLKVKEALVSKIIPELDAISASVSKRPNVEVYVGKDGLKTIFENILSESKQFSCIASKKHLFKLFKYYFPHFVDRRIKAGITVRIISDIQPHDKKAPFRIIKADIKTATWLYNGKIAMISLEEKDPIGIVIDEKNFNHSQQMMFNLLWGTL
jgi:sugar-specific transcriptional regulator TrmB